VAVAESIFGAIAQADGTTDELAQYAQVERLGDEIKRAQLERAHRGFNIAVRV